MSGRHLDNPTTKGFARFNGDAKVAAAAAVTIAAAASEDLPKLRSVPVPLVRGSARMQDSPLVKLSKPIPGMVATTSYAGRDGGGDIGGRSFGSFYGVQKEWDGAVCAPPALASETWDVQLEDLERIPAFFPLEKTHREIAEEPSVIASRISAALQALSIQTEFCKKSVKAKCQTNDCVSFRIRMYAGSDIGVPVVVEIQRRSGAPSSFMRTCRVLLDAASLGKVPTPRSLAAARDPFPTSKWTMPKLVPAEQMKCLQNVPDRVVQSTNVTESLDHVVRLLSGEKDNAVLEEELLALENLYCLTDLLKSAPKTVLEASEAILFHSEMRDLVFQQALSTTTSSHEHQLHLHHEIAAVTSSVEAAGEGMTALVGRKRQLAYAVLAHSIESMSGCGRTSMKMDDPDHLEWFSTRLIPALVAALHEAPEAACVAYQASRCATLLASHSDSLRCVLRVHRGILERAHEFGLRRHELLRDQVWTCLQLLT